MFATRRSLDFVTLDVFTDQRFGGNQLAVIPDGRGLDSDLMQKIAREFNFSETIFILPAEDAAYAAQIRIFTPVNELPFAGHPLVGAGWFLAHQRLGQGITGDFTIKVAAGPVAIRLLGPADHPTGAQLTAPQPFALGAMLDVRHIASCIGLTIQDIETNVHVPVVAGCGLNFAYVQIKNRSALDRAKPNAQAFEQFLPLETAVGLYLYTLDAELDVESRMFAPLILVPEDPATGSATVGFIGLYGHFHRPDRQIGLVRQQIRQGHAMGRPSLLLAEAEKHQGKIVATLVGGDVVPMTRGQIFLD